MTVTVKVEGANKSLSIISGHSAGSIRRLNRGWSKVAGVWRQTWQDEVVAYIPHGTVSPVLVDYFSEADLANTILRKRAVILAGSHIGANTGSYAVDVTYSAEGSFSGELILDNYGTISGIGGAADSGVGGNALNIRVLGREGQKLIVNNKSTGIIRAGGGGGGRAGNGGAGYYQTPYTYTEGPGYGGGTYWASSAISSHISWAGATYSVSQNATSYSVGGWTYYRGAFVENPDNITYYYISRSQTRYTTHPTAGGIAGNAGRGQGYDGAAAAGAAAVAGGTNAGASGKSGDGGDWGEAGHAGANGADGNNGAGTAGATGGLAGFYLTGSENVTLNNFGTVQGRLQ